MLSLNSLGLLTVPILTFYRSFRYRWLHRVSSFLTYCKLDYLLSNHLEKLIPIWRSFRRADLILSFIYSYFTTENDLKLNLQPPAFCDISYPFKILTILWPKIINLFLLFVVFSDVWLTCFQFLQILLIAIFGKQFLCYSLTLFFIHPRKILKYNFF